MSMYQKRKSTGDPICPSEIRGAKQLYEEIKKKTDLSDCEDGRSGEEEEEKTNNDNDNYDDDDEDNVERNHDCVDDADDAPPPAKRSKKATGDGVAFLTRREEQQGGGIKPLDRIVRSRYKKKSSANDEEDFSFKKLMKFAMFQSAEDANARREEARAMQKSNQDFMKMMMMTFAAATAGARAPRKMTACKSDDDDKDDDDDDTESDPDEILEIEGGKRMSDITFEDILAFPSDDGEGDPSYTSTNCENGVKKRS